jgi:hypothetical protein
MSQAPIDMAAALPPVRLMARTSSNGWCDPVGRYRSSDIPMSMMPTKRSPDPTMMASGLAPSSHHGIGGHRNVNTVVLGAASVPVNAQAMLLGRASRQ